MLNLLWGWMLLAGTIWGLAAGRPGEVVQGLIDSAADAVSLAVTMLGILSFWCGILEIADRSGLIDWLAARMSGVLDVLFPELPAGHPARKPIAVNMIANILGLGAAATPAGLSAMLAMDTGSDAASNSMCTFLILNLSSLQLIPVSMLAYRSQFGSANPAAVIGPAFIATACSTMTAVIFCKIMDRRSRL